ncbi:methyl-accepting chemotaxis protein [Vallicoccus soli]|uniref:Chemotaxis protein n=1 Tax=Vallicoccus soli TaxID=2339232 RepID=A0A3A3Z3E5_9ACTN|nr:methyl-accepting chemotaxis protein [Vallicoccus soli]RJK97934.1 chemotaxis protein [Vallicoccus soli]
MGGLGSLLGGRAARRGEAEQLALYREAVARVAEVCAAAARGDSEARVVGLPGAQEHQDLAALRTAVNGMLDRTDAFVREAGASLTAASEGRFHRRFLLRGMLGAFRDGAVTISRASAAMQAGTDRVESARTARLGLADEFETVVLSMSEQVATASTEMSASAAGLTGSAAAAVDEVGRAQETIRSLTRSSEEIQQVVALISEVAAQTKLLALNATIEAARAGEAGKGFAVVASEVKELADQTGRATEQVIAQVASIQQVTDAAVSVISGVGTTVAEMNALVEGIAVAVDGGSTGTLGGDDFSGLSQMAERLRAEMTDFLAVMRRD